MFLLLAGVGNAVAADIPLPGEPVETGTLEPSLNYPGCVRLALKQSPYLSASSIEIDLRRIDESDSRYSVVPSIYVRSRYFVNQPSKTIDDSKPYVLEFFTEPYNPLEPYYSLQARRLITKIAVLTHLKSIADCLQRLAGAFLELDALDRLASCQDDVIELEAELVEYTTSRMNSGGASLLDARVAEQEASLARLEKQRIVESRATILEGIKGLLGLDVSHRLELVTKNASGQILEDFIARKGMDAQLRGNPTENEIQALRKELQDLHIKLARTRFFPHLLFRMESGDPLNRINNGDLYFSLGVEMPIWDGMKRSHDVTRQKRLLKQIEAEGEVKDIDFAGKWKAAKDRLKNAEADLQVAVKQAEIAQLKERQSEIAYQSGRQPYSTYITERKSHLDSCKNVASKTFEREKALLGLYHLSGELLKRYVDAGRF